MKTLIRLWKDESGASAAEYALILAIIGAAIAIAAIGLGEAVANSMNDAAKCVNSDTKTQYSANCT
jgi:pilus assembly protein Flp/PilA